MKKIKRILLALAALLAVLLVAVAAYPFVAGDMETETLDDAARAAMSGETFLRLPDGVVHYELAGPEDGPPVMLVHGFTTPMFVWDSQFEALTEAGFRVLRFDLYGRGFSDRPDAAYDIDLFDRELTGLLDALGFDKPVSVVGLSMGGAVTINFVDRHPERVRKFALFAPSGFRLHVPLKYKMIQWPGVGEWAMKAMGDSTLANVTRHMNMDEAQAEAFQKRFSTQMRYRGFKRALLRTLRNYPLLELDDVYRRVGARGIPCALFWGDDDHVVPFEHHERVQEAIPNIAFHVIPGGSHTVCYDDPEKVNAALLDFLRE